MESATEDRQMMAGPVNPDRQEHPGHSMYRMCADLFPICRSLTGNGVRKTLARIRDAYLPDLKITETPSGTRCFDWTVPPEWNIRDAYIIDPEGNKILDFRESNLHVVGYSAPVDAVVPLEELQKHLYSIPGQPDAIPYVTSYYEKRWGFCMGDRQRQRLKPGDYRILIDSDLEAGSLTYAELLLPGASSQEIFFSTYVCHPSMANNELSGPAVTTFLGRWLRSLGHRRYSYRLIFIPETIGSILYLSRHLQEMKENVVAGFNVTCIGDDRGYSYVPSRHGDTLADRAALHVLKHTAPDFRRCTYLEGGSDERQYCSPGVDLPVVSVMRSKYWEYPEYHTSLDNLEVISPAGLQGGFEALRKCVLALEHNEHLRVTTLCEPQLGRRGLYPTLSTKSSFAETRNMMNLLTYADGCHDLLQIADILGVPVWRLTPIVERLKREGLLRVQKEEI